MVAAYKVSLLEEAIARLLVKVDTVILANLVLGENVVPEFLQRDCTPDKLAAALLPLLTRHAGAAAPGRGLRPARRRHGDRPAEPERPRRGARAGGSRAP